MTEDHMMHCFAGDEQRYITGVAVTELDGVPHVVGLNDRGVVQKWALPDGESAVVPLDLPAAAPEDEWYHEQGWEEGDDFGDPNAKVPAGHIVAVMTVTRLDGRPVVVTGGNEHDLSSHTGDADMYAGAVRVWDLRTGRKVGKVMAGDDPADGAVGAVCSLAVVSSKAGPIAVNSSESGLLQAWNLLTNELGAYAVTTGENGVMGAATIGGRPIAVTGGESRTLEAWDLLSGERFGALMQGVRPAAQAIAVIELEGRAVAVVGGDDPTIQVWEVGQEEPIGLALAGHTSGVTDLATAWVRGRAIVVSGSDDDTTRVWDLASGEQIGEPLMSAMSLTVAEVGGVPVLVTGHADTTVRVWDLSFAGAQR
ncbi:hypothetical protein OG339_20270 [Streptosporangium sp. NBC_01495]|uniref:hypothetical protein n=1 Tax=Streptosporangium sp. NBC_01495 TaxID=2903899 RepID=UPI002E33BAB7|nr:hypothetical protein [Streptosporangium sp. NBC_01495]